MYFLKKCLLKGTDLGKYFICYSKKALLTVLPLGPGAPAAPWGPGGPRGPGKPGAPATPEAPCRGQHKAMKQSHHAVLPVMILCGFDSFKTVDLAALSGSNPPTQIFL